MILKRFIFKKAMKLGCDVDGDILIYRGNYYYVHVLNGTCVKTEAPEMLRNIKYPKRFFITTRYPQLFI